MSVFMKTTITSMRRRKKEIRRISLVTLIAVVFMASGSLFQDIVNRYLREVNYKNYGDWVISNIQEGALIQDNELVKHPYLDQYSYCQTGLEVISEKGKLTKVYIGTIKAELLEMGNLSLYEGRMIEDDKEIVMDLASLARLGYSYDIGQNIIITCQDEETGAEFKQEFTLVGTIRNFSSQWACEADYPLPGAIVSEQALKQLGGAQYSTIFYHLDRAYEEIDASAFYIGLSNQYETLLYNTYVYDGYLWDSEMMIKNVTWCIIFIAVAALTYLMMSYTTKRKKSYYRLRCIGATKGQVRKVVLVEVLYATLPYALAGIIAVYLLGAGVTYVVAKHAGLPYFFRMNGGILLKQVASVFGTIVISCAIVLFSISDKKIAARVSDITPRRIKKLHQLKLNRKDTRKIMLARQQKVHPYQRAVGIFTGIIVSCILIFSFNKIYYERQSYKDVENWSDYEAYKCISVSADCETIDGGVMSVENSVYNMYQGVDEETKNQLSLLIGVDDITYKLEDGTHVLDWEGKDNSPIIANIKEKTGMSQKVDVPDVYCEYYMKFYEQTQEFLAKLEPYLKDKTYDENALSKGEQVILVIDNTRYEEYDVVMEVTDEEEEVEETQREPIYETTIQVGDTINIQSGDKKTEVIVGGILYASDLDEIDLGLTNGIYGVYASEKLAERIANIEGKTIQKNKVYISLNQMASFESTEKQLATIFTEKEMDYSSMWEEKQQMYTQMTKNICIYLILVVAVLMVYFIIQMNMTQTAYMYRYNKYRLLKQLGMENRHFINMSIKEGVKDGIWLVCSIPIVYLVSYLIAYNDISEQAKMLISQGGEMLLYADFLHQYTNDINMMALATVLSDTTVWSFLMVVIGLLLFKVILNYIPTKQFIREGEKNRWQNL